LKRDAFQPSLRAKRSNPEPRTRKNWIASSQELLATTGEGRNFVKQPCVYIMANRRNGTLYTGVTSNPPKRVFEHREGLVKGFSKKYDCKILVWYELHESMYEAISREKQIKAGSRAKKLALIESLNPYWKDLYETLL
jgi:predicted GIY-YIG superfamily endonuclease